MSTSVAYRFLRNNESTSRCRFWRCMKHAEFESRSEYERVSVLSCDDGGLAMARPRTWGVQCMAMCISISGVGAQGDQCTATIFWSFVRAQLLYSAISPSQWLKGAGHKQARSERERKVSRTWDERERGKSLFFRTAATLAPVVGGGGGGGFCVSQRWHPCGRNLPR
jgi:hypothetical protein